MSKIVGENEICGNDVSNLGSSRLYEMVTWLSSVWEVSGSNIKEDTDNSDSGTSQYHYSSGSCHVIGKLVKTLYYKPKGLGFESQ
jgi:hypothetical protein